MKQCPECKKAGIGPKELSEFCKNKRNSDGLQRMCKEHTREHNRRWAKENPDKNRVKGKRFRESNKKAYRQIAVRTKLKTRYGVTEQQYKLMLEEQNGECAICHTTLVSHFDTPTSGRQGYAPNDHARVDHDHATGKIRGLLCFSCNVGLGKFYDNEQLLLSAVRYLRENATEPNDSRQEDVNFEALRVPPSGTTIKPTALKGAKA